MDRRQLEKTVEVDGNLVTLTFAERERPHWVSRRWNTYKDADGRDRGWWTEGHMSGSQQDYHKKPRLYVSTRGETLLENLVNRHARPSTVWGKVLRKAAAALELPGKLGWYNRAGCSCPCSPGFIWTNAPAFDFGGGYVHTCYDVYATIENAPTVRDDDDALAVRAFYAAQVVADPTLPLETLASTRL